MKLSEIESRMELSTDAERLEMILNYVLQCIHRGDSKDTIYDVVEYLRSKWIQ